MLKNLMEQLEKHAQETADNSLQSRIAQEMGWVLVSGKEAAMTKPVLTLVKDADKAGASVLEDSQKYEKEKETMVKHLETFESFLGSVVFQAMQVVCGRCEGMEVYLFPGHEGGSENSASRRTVDMVVLLKEHLGIHLHLYPERWYSKFGKALFGLQDIQVGDKVIDDAYMIKAKRPRAVNQLLAREEVARWLRELACEHPRVGGPPIVNDVSVRNTIVEPQEPDEVISYVKKMVALAGSLSSP